MYIYIYIFFLQILYMFAHDFRIQYCSFILKTRSKIKSRLLCRTESHAKTSRETPICMLIISHREIEKLIQTIIGSILSAKIIFIKVCPY